MTTTPTESTREQIAQRGKEIYEREVRSQVEARNTGKVVAIDVRTGEYELADDAITCATRLRARLPQAEVFFTRVGYPGLHRILSPRRG